MLGLGAEQYPALNPWAYAEKTTDADPVSLRATVSQAHMQVLNNQAFSHSGLSLYDLAENRPREAYSRVAHLFSGQFTDMLEDDWDIGSPEEDGQHAFDCLTRYVEESREPDPDIDEIEVIMYLWKRADWRKRLGGIGRVHEEILRFRTEPQDLVF